MHLLIATAADSQKGFYESLKAQVIAAGIDFMWSPMSDFTWRKLVDWEYQVAKEWPKAYIAFCDTWDTLYMGDRHEFEEVVGSQPLLLHAEKVCWPHPEKASLYPPTDSPWCYVNGTGPAGRGWAIAEAIEWGMEHCPLLGDGNDVYDVTKDNDQRFWTDVYLGSNGALDTSCRLSQSMVQAQGSEFAVKGGRLVNKIHGTKPLFVHANGAQSMIGWRGLMDILSTYRPRNC